jgi:transcriptional regulator with XRE-family HTH domain
LLYDGRYIAVIGFRVTKMSEKEALGNRLRLARLNARLTQIELGEMTGLSVKTLHRYEHGTSQMSVDHLVCLAKAIGVTLEWLCNEGAESRSPFADVEGIIAQFTLEQFRFYTKQMAVTAKNILENYR